MLVAILLSLAAIGILCWLLFALTVHALPFLTAVVVGMWAHGTGAGMPGAIALGFAAGIATIVGAQVLFSSIRSTALRLPLALAFAIPASVAGYHAVLGIAAIGAPSETWQHFLAVAGAVGIGLTAAARLALFADRTVTAGRATRTPSD